MRQVFDNQTQIGLVDISKIELDINSRDEIPQVLRGLQYIYTEPTIRKRVFAVLEKLTPPDVDPTNGRMGMLLWKIFVMGVLRLNCNWNYDHLQNMVNEHRTIRQMLRHGWFEDRTKYALQTIKDNVVLFTPEILVEINQIVVEAGHQLVTKSTDELKASWDSFVAKTNVHFPTDISLLYDAMRKSIQLTGRLCNRHGVGNWRQYRKNIKMIKKRLRKIQKMKHSTSKNEEKKAKKAQEIKDAHQTYIATARYFLDRIETTLAQVPAKAGAAQKEAIANFVAHAERQVDHIERRVIKGETIPHNEKVLSIFEPHTEWIVKGKAGVPVELGLRVAVIKDHNQFILHYMVMEQETDDKVVVPMTEEAKKKFPALTQCTYDKGGHSPTNQKALAEILDRSIMPKKGRLSAADKEREYSDEFIKARHQHSAVESSINALENHGLDICPDHGIDGFKRYVGLAVVGRNLQILGVILQKRDRQRQKQQATLRQSRMDQARLKAA